MSLEIEQMHPLYAARIHGVDIRRPVSESTLADVMAELQRRTSQSGLAEKAGRGK